MSWVPFWPRTAAVSGEVVNTLFVAEVLLCGLILSLVFGLIFRFCLHYRRGSAASRADRTQKSWIWEIGWTTATLVAFLALFVWGASLHLALPVAPRKH